MEWQSVINPAAIAAIAACVGSVASLITAMKTHNLVNHRMDELLKLAKEEAAAEATIAGQTGERNRKIEAVAAAAEIQVRIAEATGELLPSNEPKHGSAASTN